MDAKDNRPNTPLTGPIENGKLLPETTICGEAPIKI